METTLRFDFIPYNPFIPCLYLSLFSVHVKSIVNGEWYLKTRSMQISQLLSVHTENTCSVYVDMKEKSVWILSYNLLYSRKCYHHHAWL